MDALSLPLLVYYIAILVVFCVYGVHRYWLVWLFLRSGGLRAADDEPAGRFDELPMVTVQLPMFNEHRVAERIIEAACGLEYPRDRLQIQVLDDSTDATVDVARRCCERMRHAGHDVDYRHRTERGGYKAGALAEGLKSARGEIIALFDADFVPPPDILRRIVHHFTDDEVGMVQARWGHLNRDDSLLTRLQALSLDGHFVVEQTARARTGRWFNFNGTAGAWRRRCIDDAGGWEHDTLTEDTDISYRAQLRGWRFRYLPTVVCPAELPPTVSALANQQHRWNKGLAQTALKLLPTIMRSDGSVAAKVETFFHLTSSLPYAAMCLLTLLVAPVFLIGLPTTGTSPAIAVALGVLCIALGTGAAGTFYVVSQHAQGRPVGPTLLRLPALMAIGIGVSLINTRAAAEAILGRQSPFVRTPKFNGARVSEPDPHTRGKRIPPGLAETVLGAVLAACIVPALSHPYTLVGAPFVGLFAAGYLAIGVSQLREALRAAPAAEPEVSLEAPQRGGPRLRLRSPYMLCFFGRPCTGGGGVRRARHRRQVASSQMVIECRPKRCRADSCGTTHPACPRSTRHPSPAEQHPMDDKARLIASILELNPSATAEWLERFGGGALQRYLEHLQFAREPRGGDSYWIRDGETPAVVTRKPAA